MTWLQLIVLCGWLSVVMIAAADKIDKWTLKVVTDKLEKLETQIEEMREEIENIKSEMGCGFRAKAISVPG
jgi:uncharacterized protein (UPF0335 family)